MHLIELEIKETTESNTSASYLLIRRDGQLHTSVTINITISISILQTLCSWVAMWNLPLLWRYLFHKLFNMSWHAPLIIVCLKVTWLSNKPLKHGWSVTIYIETLHWLNITTTHDLNTELDIVLNSEVSTEHLRRVWHADREHLLLGHLVSKRKELVYWS